MCAYRQLLPNTAATQPVRTRDTTNLQCTLHLALALSWRRVMPEAIGYQSGLRTAAVAFAESSAFETP